MVTDKTSLKFEKEKDFCAYLEPMQRITLSRDELM